MSSSEGGRRSRGRSSPPSTVATHCGGESCDDRLFARASPRRNGLGGRLAALDKFWTIRRRRGHGRLLKSTRLTLWAEWAVTLLPTSAPGRWWTGVRRPSRGRADHASVNHAPQPHVSARRADATTLRSRTSGESRVGVSLAANETHGPRGSHWPKAVVRPAATPSATRDRVPVHY